MGKEEEKKPKETKDLKQEVQSTVKETITTTSFIDDTTVETIEIRDVDKLRLVIHKGVNLMKTDIVGKSDPYVVIQHGGKKYQSKTIKNNQNPVWNFEVEIPVDSKDKDIKINVFDQDIGKDDPMGNVILNVHDLLREPVSNKSVKLKDCKSGEIWYSSSTSDVEMKDTTIKKEDISSVVSSEPKENVDVTIQVKEPIVKSKDSKASDKFTDIKEEEKKPIET